MQRRRGFVAALLGIAMLVATGLRGRLRRYAIAEHSMAPQLIEGDWTVARRLSGLPRRGAIVVFAHPQLPEMELVKRVVGLPGEIISISNGQVHVDGVVLAEAWADGPTRPDGEWKLDSGTLFVLGDARAASVADSRSIGPIKASDAGWQISGRYWPLRSIGHV